jgi:hypothetical protein
MAAQMQSHIREQHQSGGQPQVAAATEPAGDYGNGHADIFNAEATWAEFAERQAAEVLPVAYFLQPTGSGAAHERRAIQPYMPTASGFEYSEASLNAVRYHSQERGSGGHLGAASGSCLATATRTRRAASA